MFNITQGKGFYMQFANGYAISVQFGAGNYCENRGADIYTGDYKKEQAKLGEKGSDTAEIAVMQPDGEFCGLELEIFKGDDVEGWCTPERVLEVMNIIAAKGQYSRVVCNNLNTGEDDVS